MKIQQVSHNKVEVTVTPIDLLALDMSISSLKSDSPDLHKFLFKVMDQIQSETTFNPNNGQIVVEAVPATDGILLTVTKISSTEKKVDKRKFSKNVTAVIKKPTLKTRVYTFSAFEEMTQALSEADASILKDGALYEYESQYFLVLRILHDFIKHNAILSEFYEDEDDFKFADAILEEHGNLIASGEKLLSLADGIKKYRL